MAEQVDWFHLRHPVRGVLPSRAHMVSDAPTLSLNGSWRFRYSGGVQRSTDVADPRLDDTTWPTIPVPGHWQLQGFGAPAYTNTNYPFPVDPPFVPDENPTGDYRFAFSVPAGFLSEASRAVLRFDGVDGAFRVWLNGTEVGMSVGSRLPAEFDVTDAVVVDGPNVLAVRVQQWSSASYLEDQDMWWLSGIFRDVTLLSRPAGGIDDLFVTADFDSTSGSGALLVRSETDATVSIPELGVRGRTGERIDVGPVEPWSAEAPRRYRMTVSTSVESVRLSIGFRTVAIVGGVLMVNGSPIRFRGVNRHEFDPDRGRAVSHETMLTDVLLMKRHNINAVRTSHYPPHPDFLDLCDEYGLWVIDECDLETHGFEGVGWRGNVSDDPSWRPAFVDRMRRTVERDKNHPCVVMWSLGNESGRGRNLSAMARWVRGRDASRPLHYEGDWSCADVDTYSRMYATHEEVAAIAAGQEPALPDPMLDARRRAMPFVHCEYGHAMGNGPGGLLEYQRLFESSPRCAGGFIWEFIDQAIRVRLPDGRQRFCYGGDFGEELHDGNFVADGILFPDRSPSPALFDVADIFTPVRLEIADGHITMSSKLDVIDTSHLRYTWTVEHDGLQRAVGELPAPVLGPRGVATLPLPSQVAAVAVPTGDARESWLTVRALIAADTSWAPAGHQVGIGQGVLGTRPVSAHGSPRLLAPAADSVRIGPAELESATGELRGLGGIRLAGPRVELWRAPMDNDTGEPRTSLAAQWRRIGLHRLRRRVIRVAVDDRAVRVRLRLAPAATDLGVVVDLTWSSMQDAVLLAVAARMMGEWPCPIPRFGLRFDLPRVVDRVRWFGRGPGESYRDTGYAARVGRFERTVDEMQTPYVRPQENGHRSDVRWAELTDPTGTGIRIDGAPSFGLTVRRWTSEQLDRAMHTDELTDEGAVFLTVDAAQHGIGSASCGPGVLPQHQLWGVPATFSCLLQPVPSAVFTADQSPGSAGS